MSLDNLSLSPYLLKEMYGQLLVGTELKTKKSGRSKKARAAEEQQNNSAGPEIKFRGSARAKILVLVNEEIHSFLSDADLQFLTAILGACNISIDDTALVNCRNEPLAVYEKLDAQFAPSIILFLGTEPHLLDFPVQIPQYRIGGHNGQKYLCAPALRKIAADQEQKKLLWNALQELFGMRK